jgi:hypothetical protein
LKKVPTASSMLEGLSQKQMPRVIPRISRRRHDGLDGKVVSSS